MVFETQLALLVKDYYHLTGQWQALPGEYDLNYRLTAEGGRFVVKLLRIRPDLPALTELQFLLGERLQTVPSPRCFPRLIPTRNGEFFMELYDGDTTYILRVFTWLDGRLWAEINPHGPDLLADAGTALGQLSQALQGFDHPAAHRQLKWDITQPQWAAEKIMAINDPIRQAMARRLWQNFQAIQSKLPALPWAVNYFDANDYNVLVSADKITPCVTGMIDYGDVLWNPVIADLILGITYLTLTQDDPLEAAAHMVRGYHRIRPLAEQEIACIYGLVCSRLLISVVNSAINQHAEPDNPYLQVSDGPAWRIIQKWLQVHPDFIHFTLRHAAGLEPCPNRINYDRWLASGPIILPLVAVQAEQAIYADLSLKNPRIGLLENIRDLHLFEKTIQSILDEKQALAAYGGYLETRAFYITEDYACWTNAGPAWRTVHLGLDLWTTAGSAVHAPLAGTVYRIANNTGPRNYGPTVILEHCVDDALTFYTLYGHLSPAVLEALTEGQKIAAGEQIATIGQADENGGWPPHLHFQIILHPLGSSGDYPGVALPEQLNVWASLCPDPQALCGLAFNTPETTPVTPAEMVTERQKWLGPNLSLAYQPHPLYIVRGDGTYLIDYTGRKYLDTVNNVAHVGHEHPRVVRAGQKQMALLNTNTRYLHPKIIQLAEALRSTLPASLQVCYFVNSGSEANELAYRLVKAATGRRGMAVLEMGYHGNTNTCIDLSSYKFDRKGGLGAPPHVQVIPAPDQYRATLEHAHPEEYFIQSARESIDALVASPHGLAGMIVEHILSCAGQVPVPPRVAQAYAQMIKARGGMLIADEVQTGLGRVGQAFWAFELAGVLPDIVTVGKPFGNGHPLAAVVTTPAIATAFHNGMEYFNTFGGNPVSCTIGLEVLDIIREEDLPANALRRGEQLKQGLTELQKKHPIIGDVRGEGLFLGFELVTHPERKTPATTQASYLARRARTLGLLLSTDGPYENVIKLKPPLCISAAQVDFLLETLQRLFKEDMLERID